MVERGRKGRHAGKGKGKREKWEKRKEVQERDQSLLTTFSSRMHSLGNLFRDTSMYADRGPGTASSFNYHFCSHTNIFSWLSPFLLALLGQTRPRNKNLNGLRRLIVVERVQHQDVQRPLGRIACAFFVRGFFSSFGSWFSRTSSLG